MATNATTLTNRGSSSRRALMIALAFGAISAALVFTFLSKSSGGGGTIATTPVLVAAVDIPLGQELTDTNVTLKNLPTVAKHPLSFSDKTRSDALHQIALQPIAAGQQIISAVITKDRSQVGLASQIPPGKRAIAIAVSEVTAGGGFIKPGDHVDVLGVFQSSTSAPTNDPLAQTKGDNSTKLIYALPVLQDVSVLAIGQTAQQPQQQGPATTTTIKPSADQVQAKSVTLALTPDEAQKVFLAEQIGTLRLAQRGFNDKDTTVVTPTDNSLQKLVAQPGQ
ncbi:MAG: Flp pilus assembly protein CpaB [Dehalococcoidia bacterium]